MMGLDLQRAERLLAALTRLGLIDEDRRLTEAGAAELGAGKRAVREVAVPAQWFMANRLNNRQEFILRQAERINTVE